MLRVRNDSCDVHMDYREFITVCYDVFSTDSEDRATFGLANGPAYVNHLVDIFRCIIAETCAFAILLAVFYKFCNEVNV